MTSRSSRMKPDRSAAPGKSLGELVASGGRSPTTLSPHSTTLSHSAQRRAGPSQISQRGGAIMLM